MKPAPFVHHAPTSVAEAVDLLEQYGDEAKAIAGGQSLVPLLALRLTRYGHLVDLNDVAGLDGLEVSDREVVLGAMTRQQVAASSTEVATAAPLLSRALPLVGHFQIRNRGTVGGSLAHADPASELPAVALALDAALEVAGPAGRRRRISAEDFFVGTWTTSLEPEELLVAVRFPRRAARSGFAIDEAARRHGDFAMVGVAASVALDGRDRIARAGLAFFGVASTPVRAGAAEEALRGLAAAEAGPEVLAEIGATAGAELDPPDDIHATGTYRRRIAGPMLARTIAAALEEASRG